MSDLSESLEDYIEAIAELIAVNGHAHTKEIAEKLNVKMPSVTGALRQLAKKNYITYSTHFPVCLTKEGAVVAEQVMRRHRELKRFFSGILGLPSDQAEETACRIEHIVTEETLARFVIFSDAIEKRTDTLKLKTYLTEALEQVASDKRNVILSEMSLNTRGTVRMIGRNIAETENLPLKNGDVIEFSGISLDKTNCKVRLESDPVKTLSIDLAIAENIWIEPQPASGQE